MLPMSAEAHLNELKVRLAEISDLQAAIGLLSWDQATHMPPAAGAARGRQLATLSRFAHQRFIDPEIGRLLERLEAHGASLPPESDDAALIRVVGKDYHRAVVVPPAFSAEFNAHAAESYQLWAEARSDGDFARVADALAKTIDLSRRFAELFPGYAHVADPLIDQSDEGMTVAALRPLFARLREALVPLVEAIGGAEQLDDSLLRKRYPEAGQLAVGLELAQAFGYDLRRGRQDKTHHPFAIGIGLDDVRLTTRVDERYLADGLFSTLHEAGHGMYEQGVGRELEGTPLAAGTSSGVHESQSRLWESLIGRSLSFWHYAYPQLQQTFPEQLAGIRVDDFYRAINRVSRSLVRTDADELTYNLHIIIRFELELQLLEGTLDVNDLATAWNERYQNDLGVEVQSDGEGVLQDVHWFSGPVGGAFQGYALGNVLSAQLWAAACAAHPEIPGEIREGRFGVLLGWLQHNIYRHGRKLPPEALVVQATGGGLQLEPYLEYLRGKYLSSELYG